MRRYIHKFQLSISKVGWLVKATIKIRNQCNIIIGLSLAPEHVLEHTGESAFLKSLGKKIKVFFDVGANMGEWTEELLKLNPTAKGILMEPNPECHETLTAKFGNYSNIELLDFACSNEVGKAVFFAESGGGETSSLSGVGSYRAREIEVSVTTIDEVVKSKNIRHIDYLKIDVEGFDFHVLKGAKNTLEKGLVDIIQFEYNRTWRQNGSTLSCAISYLEKYGYRTYCLKATGLMEFDINSYMEYFAYSNFISLKQL